jgi:hypothetical protein
MDIGIYRIKKERQTWRALIKDIVIIKVTDRK